MKKCIPLVMALHIVLIVLAATSFTAVTILTAPHHYSYTIFNISWHYGWGLDRYVSAYSLAEVLTYLAGYLLGLPVFREATRRGWSVIGRLGRLACWAGALTFGFEATHWIWDHQASLVVTFPALLVILWLAWGVLVLRDACARPAAVPEPAAPGVPESESQE